MDCRVGGTRDERRRAAAASIGSHYARSWNDERSGGEEPRFRSAVVQPGSSRERSNRAGEISRRPGENQRHRTRDAAGIYAAADSLDEFAVVSVFPRLRSGSGVAADEGPGAGAERREGSTGSPEGKFAFDSKGARRRR